MPGREFHRIPYLYPQAARWSPLAHVPESSPLLDTRFDSVPIFSLDCEQSKLVQPIM